MTINEILKTPLFILFVVVLAIVGICCVIIAIIGKFPRVQITGKGSVASIDIEGKRAFALGTFGLLLIIIAGWLAWFSLTAQSTLLITQLTITPLPYSTATNTVVPTETPVLPTLPSTPTSGATHTSTPTSTPSPSSTPTSTLPPFSFCQDEGMGGEETVPVNPPRSVKGIIIDLKTRRTFKNGEKYGFSLWEVEIYDPDTASNLAIGATAYASSEQDNKDCIKCLAPKAIDGDNNSRWSSEFFEPQWLRIDFSTPQVIHSIILKWQDAYAEAYCITEIK